MQVHSTLIPDEIPTIKNYSPIQLNPLLSLTTKFTLTRLIKTSRWQIIHVKRN